MLSDLEEMYVTELESVHCEGFDYLDADVSSTEWTATGETGSRSRRRQTFDSDDAQRIVVETSL